ncbi:MAG: hypothetical protein C0417_07805 [Chlorobiaceae bacterium]|nr:hypothetical protein [Chlorobiaceae bacterium]
MHFVVYAGRPDKAGTAGAAELLLPVGAKSISLAGSNIATVKGIEASYWNPAGLANMNSNFGLLISHMNYIADVNVEYVALAMQSPNIGTIGLNLKTLDVGEIPITTEVNPDGTGETTSPTFITVGGTFARNITDRIAIGVAANIIYERMARVSATGVAFNFGVQYSGIGGVNGLSVGVAVKNIGPAIRFDGPGLFREARIEDATGKSSIVKIQAAASDLPTTIEVGLGYHLPIKSIFNLNLNSVFQNNNYSSDAYNFGIDLDYRERFFFRTGLSISPDGGISENIFGSAYGFGIKHEFSGYQFEIDYAYRIVRYFSGNHVFSMIFSF